jgi:hypothetical protein
MRYAIIENTIVKEIVHFTKKQAEKWIAENPKLLLIQCGVEVMPRFTYLNIFLPPKPFPSWKLNSNLKWEAPKPYPNDGAYCWLEDVLEWKKLGS